MRALTKKSGGISLAAKLLLTALPLAAALVCLGIGRYEIAPGEVLGVLLGKLTGAATESERVISVVWGMRLPRILLALLVGGGLAAAGCAFQSLFSNPLATPDTLGVAGGAGFGAALGLLLGFKLIAVQLAALVFGFAAMLLTCFIGRSRRGGSKVTIVLSGMVVASLFSALVSFVKFVADADSQLPSITYWLMGSLASAGYGTLLLGAPFIIVGAALLFFLRWRLNVLTLPDDEARATGTNVRLARALTALGSTMITASAVSMCGQVGWVGLLVPHICRMAFGSDARRLMPASISLGAAFMVIIDTLARGLISSEIPISILTAIIGAPFFIALLRRTGGWRL